MLISKKYYVIMRGIRYYCNSLKKFVHDSFLIDYFDILLKIKFELI